MPDVIIFGIGDDWLARAACNAILIQGIGQYLVNLNIWTHNILTLLARSQVFICLLLHICACMNVTCHRCHCRFHLTCDPPAFSNQMTSRWGNSQHA